jgi:uncharacterized RDD family membrane protein YckC
MSAPADASLGGEGEIRVRELVTPEGVDLRLVLAEASERAGAFLLDIVFIAGVLIVATIVILVAAVATKFNPGELLVALWLLVAFVLRNFYFMFFELSPRAATPGKRILGLRVAARNGQALSAEAIFARNAMRELEVFLPLSFLVASRSEVDAWIDIAGVVWCGVFVFFPLFNRDRLRVGDLIGGTWVVRAPRRVLDVDLSGANRSQDIVFTREQLDAYGIKELTVLEDVLRRQDLVTMGAVADRIKLKTGIRTSLSDRGFLFAYYRELRRHLEQRLLFGRRRRDKFDKP